MTKLDRMADKEFHKLSKKEQKRINNLKRIPTAPPGFVMDGRRRDCGRLRMEDWE